MYLQTSDLLIMWRKKPALIDFERKVDLLWSGRELSSLKVLLLRASRKSKLKTVDEGHHYAILNLINVAGSAQDERQDLLANNNFLLTATKAEISALNIRTSAIEK
jgi:hypothetical protein